jgi:HPP family/Inner membrane component of T3SS, cytoplasmic domain
MTTHADRALSAGMSAGPGTNPRPLPAGTLHVLGGPARGQVWHLTPGVHVLGRAADSDLPLKDPGVSRRHCRVAVAGPTQGLPGIVTVEDLGSGNGTLVDGVWAGRPTALRPGATIVVGNSTLSWSPSASRPPAPPAPARVSPTAPASPAPARVSPTVPAVPPASPAPSGVTPTVAARPPGRPQQQVPVHPLPAAAPPRVGLHAPVSAGARASAAGTSLQVRPAAQVVVPEPVTVRLALPRKSRFPASAAPPRPQSRSTLLSTLTILGALATLAAVGMLTGLPLLFPPLAASMALIAAGSALPLAQPRNVIGGHLVSALVGFAVLALIGSGVAAAALAGAAALGAMLVLRLSHSPAVGTAVIVGATAPSAPVFLEVLVLAALILVAFGMVGARLEGKQYPVYWW